MNINVIECTINGIICFTGILSFVLSYFTYKKKDYVDMYFRTEENIKFIESKK